MSNGIVWGASFSIIGGMGSTGNMAEHYGDGDPVNEEMPVGWAPAGDERLAVWGVEVLVWFLD